MKTLIRIVIIGTITVTVLAVIFLLLLFNPPEQINQTIIFTSGTATDVKSITVQNKTGKFTFYYDINEGGYVTDNIPAYLVDVTALINFLDKSANMYAIKVIENNEITANDAGLIDPTAIVCIEMMTGEIVNLSIGTKEQISGNYYAHVNELKYVYLIPQNLADLFLLPKTQIITRYVTPQLMVSSPLLAIRDITFTGGTLTKPVTIQTTTTENPEIRLKALSFGTATHIVRGIADYQLDQSYGIMIFGSLFGITGDIVAYELNEEEMATFGFDNPYMTVDFTMKNTDSSYEESYIEHINLRIVEAGNNQYYITLNDINAVFITDRLPFMDIRYELLPVRWFLTPMLMNLSAVTITTPDREYRIEINSIDIRNQIFTLDGLRLDFDLFQSFFRLITSASHDGTYLGPLPQPRGLPLLQITYEYTIFDKSADILTVFPGEERRVNVFINGSGEFAMKDLFVTRVLEGIENLKAGKPIEENW